MIHPDAPFLGVPAEEFDRVQDVNLKGTANVIRAMLPSMMEARSGVIVGFSSGAGVKGYPEISGYCASKHAIEGLCKSLAQEVPDGMAVIPFQPGVIQTDMLKTHYGERAADYPTPEVWVQRAGPYLLSLGPEDNGQSLRLPDS
jgi:NAD(P)-dependent dehydrogenase (short-subunit alcohol dehydrogenase family)